MGIFVSATNSRLKLSILIFYQNNIIGPVLSRYEPHPLIVGEELGNFEVVYFPRAEIYEILKGAFL